MSGDSIGMMEGAFFVSKGVILEWLNELLDVSENEAVELKNAHDDLLFVFVFNSFNLLKLNNAQPDQYTAK